MAHVRQQIRDQIATTLTGLTTTGSNVYKMRRYALDDAKLPALCIYTVDETSNLITIGARTLRRVINVNVETILKGSSTAISDSLDAVCVEVEEAMAAAFDVGGLAKSAILISTEVDLNVEGEKTIGSARMVYSVEYVTSIEDPETAR